MGQDMLRLMRDPNLLPSEKQTLLSRIAGQAASMNMPCYLVGGFVRDLLLGRPVNDLDIIVEGDAIQLGHALVKKHGGKLTPHHKFHTAIWHMTPDTSALRTIDLITARTETYLRPGALPTVKPSTIEDDLHRRDFTINAMAIRMDGDHFGELLDPLNGQADLEKGVVRVLHPHSFIEDPTRIFRAVRYAERYSFILHPSSFILINPESLAILKSLSGERIRHEFDLIFSEERSFAMLLRLDELGVCKIFDPSLPKFDQKYSALLDSITPAELGISIDRVMLGYLLWLMDSPSHVIESLSGRLDFTSELTKALLAGVHLKNEMTSLKDAKPSTWTFRLEQVPLQAIYALWLVSGEPALKEFLTKWRHVKSHTTGDDLKARGLPPGPSYKEILNQLRAAWLDGEVHSIKDELQLLETLIVDS
ncbi:MAG: CCA tRNA nucleotidyltransferase [Chloroflexi bacterium]|nr:CCA tRNA nucleotidyltransferase [Chloroflexota bacterium]